MAKKEFMVCKLNTEKYELIKNCIDAVDAAKTYYNRFPEDESEQVTVYEIMFLGEFESRRELVVIPVIPF